jgi:HAD superfamily hydrolase (TIGR01549 family)
MTDRWVVLDVGETLIDESRVWATWADELGISRLTFMAAFGTVVARGGQHREVFDVFGVDDWESRWSAVEVAYGGFRADDLYPDVIPSMDALRAQGYRLAVIGNQPALRTEQLVEVGIRAEVIAMSQSMGVMKPSAAFFSRTLELLGDPAPDVVAYVGDRVDNDVRPAAAAGMRAVWLRRGPWGTLQPAPEAGLTALEVGSLTELADRIDEAFAPR